MAKTIKQRDINLLTAMDRRGEGGRDRKKHPALFVASGLSLIALAAIVVLYLVQTSDLNREKNHLNSWLKNPEMKTTQTEAINLRDAAAEATQKLAQADKLIRSLSAGPDLQGDDLLSIYEMAGDPIEIFGFRYDRADRILTLNAQCKNPARAPIFVAKLRADELFENVSYSGYTGSEYVTQGTPQVDAETGDVSPGYITSQVYLFTVTGIIAKANPVQGPGAGSEAKSGTGSGSGERSGTGSGTGSGSGERSKSGTGSGSGSGSGERSKSETGTGSEARSDSASGTGSASRSGAKSGTTGGTDSESESKSKTAESVTEGTKS